jgi:hypothetical protein
VVENIQPPSKPAKKGSLDDVFKDKLISKK